VEPLPASHFSYAEQIIGGTRVSLFGVDHQEKEWRRRTPVITRHIRQSDGVVLEQPFSRWGSKPVWQSPSFVFVAATAWCFGKRIFIADPISPELYGVDKPLAYAGAVAALGGAAAILIHPRSTSRRAFIAKIAVASVGISLFNGSDFGARFRATSHDYIRIGEFDLLDATGYGLHDFRAVTVAEGIVRICERYEPQRLASFHGALHAAGIETYLKNPWLRQKQLAYLPAQLIADTKVREYAPNDRTFSFVAEF
jgi:hypothetical protein